MTASEGPAPPRRESSPVASTRRPRLCRSVISSPRFAGAVISAPLEAIQVHKILIEDAVLQFLADSGLLDLPVLAPEVAPRLVGREDDPIMTDPAAFDVSQQPTACESDRPRGVGVDLVTLFDPVEETGHELDVSTDPTTEMHQVELDPLAVHLHERDEVVDVRSAARTGVEVEDEVVLFGGIEARVGECTRLVVPGSRIGITP